MYGMKEKNIAKAYIKLIPLNRTDVDAVRLTNWKRPTDRGVRLILLFHDRMLTDALYVYLEIVWRLSHSPLRSCQ